MESKFIMKTNKVFKRFIAFMLSTLCILTNCGIGLSISSVELTEEFSSDVAPEGYVPVESFDEIAMFSLERDSSITKKVLLIEDTLPWSSNANSAVLSSLGVQYDKVRTADFLTKNLGNYSVLIFANDQQFSTYANYSNFMTQVENFAALGGVVIFGACDGGWANGTMTTSLPGGVTKFQQYANNNHVINSSHPIVTGVLIDNIPLTDSDLYSNYCSHTSFNETSLPIGSNVILRDTIKNAPTLVEYPVGNGCVIASGLTWEHSYVQHINDSYGHFAQKALADLFKYAIVTSNANVDMAPPLAVSVTSPSKLNVVKNELGNEEYLPNPFTITANIQNIGNGMAYNVDAELVLPDGMKIVSGSPKVSLGDIDVGANYAQVTWSVEVEPSDIDKIENYSIIVTADNADTKTIEKQIEIPAIESTEKIALYLERSSIDEGISNRITLNFKLVNEGTESLQLGQYKVRYYYIDEAPNIKKNVGFYYCGVNGENLIVNGECHTRITPTKTLANSYIEFSFITTAQIEPDEEAVVQAYMTSVKNVNMKASNDFSAVNSLYNGEYGFIKWNKMPVYKNDSIVYGEEPEDSSEPFEPDLNLVPTITQEGSSTNINLVLTNNGLVPIVLSESEILYYFTNDDKYEDTVDVYTSGGAFDGEYYKDIKADTIAEISKLKYKKDKANSCLSIKFSSFSGLLYYGESLKLEMKIHNENWFPGKNDLTNDFSYSKSENELPNILVNTNYINEFGEYVPYSYGNHVSDYKPTYSAFKVGWGNENKYNNNDYEEFITGMEKHYNGVKYSDDAIGSNLENNFTFTQNNMDAILNSDVAYISGHGYFGGVVPINSMETGILGMFVANNNVRSSQFHINEHYKDLPKDILNNRFSFKEDENENVENSNLQWLIFGACAQLNDYMLQDNHGNDRTDIVFDGKYSYEYWLDTLLSNPNMKGILGYHKDAPVANFTRSDEEVIKRFLKYSTETNVYDAWIKANAFNTHNLPFCSDTLNCSLLTKDDYANQKLYDTIIDNSEVKGKVVYLYKAALVDGDVEYTESTVFGKNYIDTNSIINAVSEYAIHNDIDVSSYTPFIREISRKTFNQDGEYMCEECIEYTISFAKSDYNTTMFALDELNNETSNEFVEIAFSYNPSTEEVKQL